MERGEDNKKRFITVSYTHLMKAKRDNAAVEAALADLEAACKDENENLMPHILAAVKTYATLGEICGVMRKVFGEYEAHVNL